jgi:hypothetical protein
LATNELDASFARLSRAMAAALEKMKAHVQLSPAAGGRPALANQLNISTLGSTDALRPDFLPGDTPARRLDAVVKFLGTAASAPALSEMMQCLSPLVKGELLAPLPATASLMAAIAEEKHSLVVGVLAGLLVLPNGWPALKDHLTCLSDDEVQKTLEMAARFQRLTPNLQCLVVERLGISPIDLREVEALLLVAGGVPFEPQGLAAVVSSWGDQPLQSLVRAMVAIGQATGDLASVRSYLRGAVQTGDMQQAEVYQACSEGWGARLDADAQTSVLDAVKAWLNADVVTRDSAMSAVLEAVEQNDELISPTELIRHALATLYEHDCALVAPLRELVAEEGATEVVPDLLPVAARLATDGLELKAVLRARPMLASDLQRLRAQLTLTYLAAGCAEIPPAVTSEGVTQLLEPHASLTPAERAVVFTFAETWS